MRKARFAIRISTWASRSPSSRPILPGTTSRPAPQGLAAILTLLLSACAVARRHRAPEPGLPPPSGWPGLAVGLGAIFLLSPAIILILHGEKSPAVDGIMAPGAIAVLLGAWAALLDYVRPYLAPVAAARLTGSLAALALLWGGGYYAARQLSHPYSAEFVADAAKVNALADGIFLRSRAAGLGTPRVAVDEVTDCLDGQVLRVICYERHRVWVPFLMMLPTGIEEEPEPVLMAHLAQSDFVFLTLDGPIGPWPYDREMRRLLPRTQAWCDAHLQPVDRFSLFGQRMVLYQRREIPLP